MQLFGFLGKVSEVLLSLTPDELQEIADYRWHEMFAWWDDKWYLDRPMQIRGEVLSHSQARFVWLELMEMRDFGLIEFASEDSDF